MYDVLRKLDGRFRKDGVRFVPRHIGGVGKYGFPNVGDEFEDYLSYVVDRTLPVGYKFEHYRTGDVVVLIIEKKGE